MDSTSNNTKTASTVFNVPNQLTMARLILSVVLFVFLSFHYYLTALALFVLAGLTDFADGYWARKYGQVTQLGRIMDPFADKIVICGTFIYLSSFQDSLVPAWMTVVVVGRELLVTVLRSFIEQHGGDFSAKTAGKWKMLLQCLAVTLCLWRLGVLGTSAEPTWLSGAAFASVWAALLLTIFSGIEYVFVALKMLRKM